MKKIFSITPILCLMLIFSACDKFLDVQPEDRTNQEQITRSEYAINSVLNGIYMRMAGNSVYGHNLTISLVECLAQRYSNSNNRLPYYWFTIGNFWDTDRIAERAIESMWENLYVLALGVNDFMTILDRTTLNIPQHRMDILRGEAYGLRAFFHFDILRLWGLPPALHEFDEEFMPYNDNAEAIVLPLLSADSIVKRILEDLYEAERLLSNDPIITQGRITTLTLDPIRDFYTNRHYRMNYYAVKAMQARVYMWISDYHSAREAALAVLNAPLVQAETLFQWANPQHVSQNPNPDRVFSSEIIFGIHNRNMTQNYNALFNPSLHPDSELTPLQTGQTNRLAQIYSRTGVLGEPADGNDYRYIHLWRPAGGDKGDQMSLFKYAPPTQRNNPVFPIRVENFQPLIRMSEIYYILAECEAIIGSVAEGFRLLDLVRVNRGLLPFDGAISAASLLRELRREYEKEFFAEGQLYYFYKRRSIFTIPSGTSASDRNIVLYLPIPQKELEARGRN